jgi:Type I phosphodiesterase / nucleotide pyrophosphatase
MAASIEGPDNPFLRAPRKLTSPFTVYVDPLQPAAKIVAGGEERVLKAGEWSDWVPIEFPMIPTQTLRGMCRFYLQQTSPYLELYVSPVNLDPLALALPISTPGSFAADLALATGRYYTQGMPEDTKALDAGVFTRDEFLAQAGIAAGEMRRQFTHVLETFDDGLLFYYVGHLDQISHMMWRPMDPGHPAYDPVTDPKYQDVVRQAYIELDEMVGEALERAGDDTTLVVMSDHGFASWRRAFHLNSWLRDNGYLALANPDRPDDPGYFGNVNWRATLAYGLGLNGLYLNLQGREAQGVVAPVDRLRLLDEIAGRLLATIDPDTAAPAVTKVYRPDQAFTAANYPNITPDLIVGYAKGTRCSDESALGGIPAEVIVDNTRMWSGDHCMDHEAVPGLLLTNRPLRSPAASLRELAAAIVAEFDR